MKNTQFLPYEELTEKELEAMFPTDEICRQDHIEHELEVVGAYG